VTLKIMSLCEGIQYCTDDTTAKKISTVRGRWLHFLCKYDSHKLLHQCVC